MRHNNITKKTNKFNIKKSIIFIVFIITFLNIVFFTYRYVLKTFIYPLKHFEIIKEESNKNNIDPYLVLAIIKTESGFDKEATSSKQAKGLMQIMDSTASDLNNDLNLVENLDENIYEVDVNIALGCKYISKLITKYSGNYYLAICAYNAGMGNVDNWLEKGIISKDLEEYKNVDVPFTQTKNYLYKVISSYNMYRSLY